MLSFYSVLYCQTNQPGYHSRLAGASETTQSQINQYLSELQDALVASTSTALMTFWLQRQPDYDKSAALALDPKFIMLYLTSRLNFLLMTQMCFCLIKIVSVWY